MPISTQSAPVASNAHGTLKRIMLQGRYETLAMLSNGEQLIVAAVLPLLALIGLVFTGLLDDVAESPIDAAAPGVLERRKIIVVLQALPERDGDQLRSLFLAVTQGE